MAHHAIELQQAGKLSIKPGIIKIKSNMGTRNRVADMYVVERQSDLEHAITSGGSLGDVTKVLDDGSPPTALNNRDPLQDGDALIRAVMKGREDIVSLLLDRGANINAVGKECGTALVVAAYGGKTQIVSLLLDRGAEINKAGDDYGTALAAAAFGGRIQMVSFLLDRGADINIVGGIYGTALAAAAYGGRAQIVLLLLNRGADINKEGGAYGTALATAAFRGRTQIVTLLLDRGANINTASGKYGTALSTAAFRGKTQIVSLLLDRGADINAVGGEYGTALAVSVLCESTDVVSLLLDRGADINAVGGEYGTALAVAAFSGSTESVSLLLKHGADAMRVGGGYSTASGVYPSALDVADSEGSRADTNLLALLETAITKHHAKVDSDNNVISRPPFPMPYTGSDPALSAGHHKLQLCSRTFSTLSTELQVGGNITPEQADIPCREFKEEALWRSLAALVGLDEDTTQAKLKWVQDDVRYFVARNFDFGLAYAAARVAWKHFSEHSINSSMISIQRSRWHKHAQQLDKARSMAIEINSFGQELIVSPYSIMPRRLWDLKSHRVVDFRMLHAAQSTIEILPTFWAVSHSWTRDMPEVWTAVNQHQWPIPLPKGISLDYLRSELLTLGAEYIWLDVVCLRQEGDDDNLERIREEEWKVDVPTVGNIYRAAVNTVRYFNGLGVPFSSKGWDDENHWFQRAWTLQELADENITNGGILQDDEGQVFLNRQVQFSGKTIKLRSAIQPFIELATQLDSPRGCEVYKVVQEIKIRHVSEPVDKIPILFYLLRTTKFLCYNTQMASGDIWKQCFHLLPVERKVEILFDFPYRGSEEQWFPTWAQVLDWPTRDPEYMHMRPRSFLDLVGDIPGETSVYMSNIWTIPDAILHATHSPSEYKVEISNKLFGFYLPYLSQKPLDIQHQPIFTLAIADLGHAHNWVVCRAIEKQVGTEIILGVAEVNVLKKVGIIRTDNCGEILVGGVLQKMDCLFV